MIFHKPVKPELEKISEAEDSLSPNPKSKVKVKPKPEEFWTRPITNENQLLKREIPNFDFMKFPSYDTEIVSDNHERVSLNIYGKIVL